MFVKWVTQIAGDLCPCPNRQVSIHGKSVGFIFMRLYNVKHVSDYATGDSDATEQQRRPCPDILLLSRG